MRQIALALAALAMLLLTGCGVLRNAQTGAEPWLRPGGPRAATDSESLLMYFEHVRKLPAAELTREHEAVRQLYANSRSDFSRVRYAMLLSAPGAAPGDDARALEALEPLLKNPDSGLRSLAVMVSWQIQEQRRAHGRQQKLDALRSLDRSLIERGK